MKNQSETASAWIWGSTLNQKSVGPVRDWRSKENIHKSVYRLFLDPGVNRGESGVSFQLIWTGMRVALTPGRSFCGSFFSFPWLEVEEGELGQGVEEQCGPWVGETWQCYLFWASGAAGTQRVWPLFWIPDPSPEATSRPKSIQLLPWAWREVSIATPEPSGASAIYFFWHRQKKRKLFHSRYWQTQSFSFKGKGGKLLCFGETYLKRMGKHVTHLYQVCVCYPCSWLLRMTFHKLQMK